MGFIKEGLDAHLDSAPGVIDHSGMAVETPEAAARRTQGLAETEAKKAAQAAASADWKIGQTVVLTAGPFEGFEARVTAPGKGVVEFGGQEWPVDF